MYRIVVLSADCAADAVAAFACTAGSQGSADGTGSAAIFNRLVDLAQDGVARMEYMP